MAKRAAMLPILRCLAGALWACIKARRELALENLALRHQLAVLQRRRPDRPLLTRWDRLLWVWLSKTWPGWTRLLVVVQPDTVIRWHRSAFKLYWRWKSRRGSSGRPKIDRELRALIQRIADENPTWRAPRVFKELVRLGFEVSHRTVARYMPRRPPSPASRQSWSTFLANHRDAIAAMDLFVVPTITFRLVYGFFVIGHDRRHVLHVNVTEHPTAAWVIQQLREAFPWDAAARYLIFDRDSTFSTEVRGAIGSMGVKVKPTAFRSPWQNGVAERWIGCLRQELLNHVVVVNEDHLRQLVRDFVAYHNQDRLHCSLGGDAPLGRAIEARPTSRSKIAASPRVGGLHHRYGWREAA